jgi:hypothetical protein
MPPLAYGKLKEFKQNLSIKVGAIHYVDASIVLYPRSIH